MFRDYGKMAYVKVSELEKRFEKLQKELLSSITNTLSFDLVTPEKRNVFRKTFLCNCLKTSTVTIKVNFQSNLFLSIEYDLFINGNSVQKGAFSDGKGTLDFQAGVGEGKLDFEIELYSPSPFLIENLFITVNGSVEYFSEFNRISALNHQQMTYFSAVNSNKLVLYVYDEQGLTELFNLNEIKDASIAGLINGELYVLYIDVSNVLRVLIYDVETFHGIICNLNANGATSVCGYPYGDGIKVFYTLTGSVFSGEYVKDGNFKGENTWRKGNKVFCEPNIIGVYIVSDAYNSNKLVTENETVVLSKGNNHHITQTQTGYIITYSDKNVLYAQELDDRLNTPILTGYCDEKVKLYDGNYLVRVRDSLKIRKD